MPRTKKTGDFSDFFVHWVCLCIVGVLIFFVGVIKMTPLDVALAGLFAQFFFEKFNTIIDNATKTLFVISVAQLIILCRNSYTKIQEINKRSEVSSGLIPNIDRVLSSVDSKIKRYDNVLFEENKNKADDRIKELLYEGKISKMRIICYGTGLLGGTIQDVLNYNSDKTHSDKDKIELKVVICSSHPLNYSFEKDSIDKIKLNDAKEALERAQHAEVFISEIIPTVRACIVTGQNNVPIYCYYQPYYLYPQCFKEKYQDHFTEATLLHAQGYSPMIIADEHDVILSDLVKSCNREFERLSSLSKCENGKV